MIFISKSVSECLGNFFLFRNISGYMNFLFISALKFYTHLLKSSSCMQEVGCDPKYGPIF